MYERVMYFIDGENLVFRYQEMLDHGRQPLNAIKHERDVYVWHGDLMKGEPRGIVRVNYYTSAVGDSGRILRLNNELKKINYSYQGPRYGVGGGRFSPGSRCDTFTGFAFPRVFKKPSQSQKTRSVDINITIDILHYSSLGNLDAIYLVSGDGDFLPLIREVMRKGVKIYLMALSSGLNQHLPNSVDKYECIDDRLFQQQNA